MLLGDTIEFKNGSYDIRAIVDGRYVVRIRNRERNTEKYEVWTSRDREEFHRKLEKNRAQDDRKHDFEDRNRQMYERRLSGETYAGLAREFGIDASRVSQVCARQARKERGAARQNELHSKPVGRDRFSTASEEWEQAKPSPTPSPPSRTR